MTEFDVDSILNQLYDNRDVDSSELLQELGPWALDFSNIFGWSENIPDVNPQSARLFQIWAEDEKSKKVIGTIKGYFTLVPFTFSSSTLKEYYMLQAEVPFYPMAIITSLRTTIKEIEKRMDYRITGVMQLLASSSPFYDKATIDHHIRKVKTILEKQS